MNQASYDEWTFEIISTLMLKYLHPLFLSILLFLFYRVTQSFSGQFTQVDRDAKFLKDEDVDGIAVVTDLDLVKEMQHKIGRFADRPIDFFPAAWAVSLNQKNFDLLSFAPYVVTPKPDGTLYLLYVDSVGDVYLENQTQNFFKMSENRTVQLLSSDRQVLKDTLLDGYFVRRICSTGSEGPDQLGRLTFIIQDAIRCNGTDLTKRGILQRIDTIEVILFYYST